MAVGVIVRRAEQQPPCRFPLEVTVEEDAAIMTTICKIKAPGHPAQGLAFTELQSWTPRMLQDAIRDCARTYVESLPPIYEEGRM